MKITRMDADKKRFLDLLLLADEQEDMIDRYLEKGEMYALMDGEQALCVCVVMRCSGCVEIKNLAVHPDHRGCGHGRRMIAFVEENFCRPGETLCVGTGDSPLTVPFYEKCGFVRDRVVKDFFTIHYDHEIWEAGVLLKDMVYLKKTAQKSRRG